ncbi:ATP-binding cassette domain-containing protein [Campylobacter sp. 9BO]|uniref:ATP-binding cassette domain-containing protein n=1 Tax=Campylobacter sp. 9BO TaxID=3424759 RepID=UPI003D3306D1
MSLLEVRNLSHSFDSFSFFGAKTQTKVLKNVSFKMQSGEILGLLGRSGSGKSTIAKIIMGLIKQKSGEIYLNNELVEFKNLEKKREFYKQVQIVFQDSLSAVNPHFSVKEIIEEPLIYLSELDENARINRINELLDELGICKSYLAKGAKQLSGGELQRICIARAMAIKPKLIIFDESLSSLDAPLVVEILKLIKRLKGETSFLFITHDMRLVKLVCDSVVLIEEGEVVESIKNGESFKSQVGIELSNAVLMPC